MTALSALLMLLACTGSTPVEPACAEPLRYWPDADGDGVGEPGATYSGCSPPAGWVTTVGEAPDRDTWLWDTGPFGGSGHSGSGYTGFTAYTGLTAYTGVTAYTGDTGSTAATGSAGPTGDTGTP
ncbi:MAG: hypothetical protein R3F61_06180 [Myxococcota bacterium]